jgi:FixJ family two-component response regulator
LVTGPESRTPSERRVADFAARHLSNREIAETLWVSLKTRRESIAGHTYRFRRRSPPRGGLCACKGGTGQGVTDRR